MHRKAFVFSEPGTGKTLSALWAADYLMQRGEVRRCLILCPLSIMQSAWLADLSNSIIHRSAIVAHHTQASRRIEMIQQDYEFVIANYDGLNLIADEVKNDGRFDLVIVDEANAYKTVTTKRWKALKSILTPKTHVWMMTGTPASQSPADAYGLAKIVNPEGVPNFYTSWRDKVMNKVTLYKWAAKHNAADLVHEALQPAIRFSKAQCLDLPPVLTTTREVPLTPQQAKYYNLLKDRMLVQAAGETISAVNAAAGVSKLLQISCGAVYTDEKEVLSSMPPLALVCWKKSWMRRHARSSSLRCSGQASTPYRRT
jgi:SNF2 family DNA or RNA helicase